LLGACCSIRKAQEGAAKMGKRLTHPELSLGGGSISLPVERL